MFLDKKNGNKVVSIKEFAKLAIVKNLKNNKKYIADKTDLVNLNDK